MHVIINELISGAVQETVYQPELHTAEQLLQNEDEWNPKDLKELSKNEKENEDKKDKKDKLLEILR